MKNNPKRDIILNTMESFMKEGTAGTVSVSTIAKRANIATGVLYYYFKSKEEIMDAVVNRQYDQIIENVRLALSKSNDDAITKLKLLFYTYTSASVDSSLDQYLHLPQNAALHQKSLATILLSLKPMISEIFNQGIQENVFFTDYPDEIAEILLSSFTFLFDPGIFEWSNEEMQKKRMALAEMLGTMLHTSHELFAFLY